MAYYVVSLHTAGCVASTISTHLSALSLLCRLLDVHDPTKAYMVQRCIMGVRNVSGSPDVRLPITPPILSQLLQALPRVSQSPSECTLFRAVFTLCFHAFLRISEVAFQDSNTASHILSYHSLSSVSSQGFTIVFSSFKHSRGRTHRLQIKPFPIPLICPVSALLQYLSIRGTRPGYLFVHPSGSPITRSQFNTMLQRALSFCGLSSCIKSHSFRIGAATFAAQQGLSDAQIRSRGRWHSNAFLRYIR